MRHQPVGTGDTSERPIRMGGALVTLVEPHPGHEVAYNRWYERDHFYAGCMIGAWTVAGARFVATRECKDRRLPSAPPLTGGDPVRGSYLALYWVLAGHLDDWIDWGTDQVNWLHEQGRMFAARDHVHTAMYRYHGERAADPDGVPAELALDRRFPGLVMVVGEAADGATTADVDAWLADRPAPGDLAVSLTPVPLRDDAPGDVPRDALEGRFCQLWFTGTEPLSAWDDWAGGLAASLHEDGPARVLLASPFLPTVPGTDTYADRLR